jgi:hypothetical protein
MDAHFSEALLWGSSESESGSQTGALYSRSESEWEDVCMKYCAYGDSETEIKGLEIHGSGAYVYMYVHT